ncbi:DUF72 domain-containing protein [Chryseolinea sp. H1M3-3]|uniref:DUF72 domain-containing protein n=1 Tax=Chryseolinea sp. H1M3-3 TaxID=3034144 RepID=UPI0023EBF042|nr:DUF72 domain-containing protein [Chryseolinea sp. H1M3-3]
MKKWWIGCSGFHYNGWREVFYPKGLSQRKWFEFYCESFNTVELNVTFYRFPRVKDLQNWYDRSPEDFAFTVKAPRLITHYKRFNNASRELHDFYDTVAKGLRDKLGAILFQLHPQTEYSEEKLEQILKSLDPAFTNVIEFRHISWWQPKVVKALQSHQVTFCSISYPGLPDDIYKTAPAMYYRFHGVPKLYLSSYSKVKLQQVVKEIIQKRNVDDVYVYFNNDIEVAAVSNARTVQGLVSKKKSL